jgi:hypothetical protein
MFIPAVQDKDEIYGSDLDESISLLKSYLYKHDIVASRMLTHLVDQLRHEVNSVKSFAKELHQDNLTLRSPKGFVTDDGVSVYWYKGKLYLNNKEMV